MTVITLVNLIRFGGLMHFGILIASALVPGVLDWKSELLKLQPLTRQLVWVHGAFIVLTIIGLGTIAAIAAPQLAAGGLLARTVCAFVAIFWLVRLSLQFFLFDPKPFLSTTVLKVGYHGLTVVFVYLAVVFGWDAMSGMWRSLINRLKGGVMYTVYSYLAYLPISVALTIWVARTLQSRGRVFLVDAFAGNEQLADSVNHLLVVGFYLINIGYVTLALKYGDKPSSVQEAIEFLSTKVGLVLLILGVMHFANLISFATLRQRSSRSQEEPVLVDSSDSSSNS